MDVAAPPRTVTFGEALACQQRGDAAAAERLCEALLRETPTHADAWHLLGLLQHARGARESAAGSLRRSLELHPRQPAAQANLATALLSLGQADEALALFSESLKLSSASALTWYGRGCALLQLGRPAEALADLERALELVPDLASAQRARAEALQRLFTTRGMACDWSDYERVRNAVIELIQMDQPMHPVVALSACDSPALQRRCAQQFAARADAPLARRADGYHHERPRVAYVSADFREHAVAFVIAGVLEHHDRERVDTIGIALQPVEGVAGERVARALGTLHDVSHHSDREVAILLRALEVDIVVDLAGYTRGARPGIFAHHPCPCQVGWLGYAGTSGARHMDYLLADATVIPPGTERDYSEQIVRLPHCYLPADDRRARGPQPSRAECGLPDAGLVFCAFTNPYKLNPPLFDIWMKLLLRISGSVLWLGGVGQAAHDNLRREARRRGVDPARLVFAAHLANRSAHLARLTLADVFLDTYPYNAHSTACDALSAGVPVVTCAGQAFAARVAASVLVAVDLPELVTASLADYGALVLQLAQDAARRRTLRSRVAEQCAHAPLFDAARFARDLECAYWRMWQCCERNEPPRGFALGDDGEAPRQ